MPSGVEAHNTIVKLQESTQNLLIIGGIQFCIDCIGAILDATDCVYMDFKKKEGKVMAAFLATLQMSDVVLAIVEV